MGRGRAQGLAVSSYILYTSQHFPCFVPTPVRSAGRPRYGRWHDCWHAESEVGEGDQRATRSGALEEGERPQDLSPYMRAVRRGRRALRRSTSCWKSAGVGDPSLRLTSLWISMQQVSSSATICGITQPGG
eukprot:759956-Hanusia_phi.AAC.1